MAGRLGKLRAAAVWLITPPAEDAAPDEDEESLRALGVPAEQIAAARQAAAAGEDDDEAFEVWAWHRDAMRLFGAVRTQWRVASAFAGVVYVGLDYGVLGDTMRRLGLGERLYDEELFEQLRVMESAAKKHLNAVPPTGQ